MYVCMYVCRDAMLVDLSQSIQVKIRKNYQNEEYGAFMLPPLFKCGR